MGRKITDLGKVLDEESKRQCLESLKSLPHQRKKTIEVCSQFYSPSGLAKEVKGGTSVGKEYLRQFKGELTPEEFAESIRSQSGGWRACLGLIPLPKGPSVAELEEEAEALQEEALEKIR